MPCRYILNFLYVLPLMVWIFLVIYIIFFTVNLTAEAYLTLGAISLATYLVWLRTWRLPASIRGRTSIAPAMIRHYREGSTLIQCNFDVVCLTVLKHLMLTYLWGVPLIGPGRDVAARLRLWLTALSRTLILRGHFIRSIPRVKNK